MNDRNSLLIGDLTFELIEGLEDKTAMVHGRNRADGRLVAGGNFAYADGHVKWTNGRDLGPLCGYYKALRLPRCVYQ